jgi:hypothetical protein
VTSNTFPADKVQMKSQREPLSANGIIRGSFLRLLGRYLMYVVVFEAAVLGSGQLLRLGGGFTAKMLLFALSVLFVLLSFVVGERLRSSTLILVLLYFISVAAACLVGLLHNAPLDRMGKDISPILSFLLLPFFELTIRNKKHVTIVVRIIMVASAVITFVYILIVGGLLTGRVTYADISSWLGNLGPSSGMGDFMFDTSTDRVFYKGAIYLGIALIFFLFRRKRWAKIASLFMVLNLIAIGSRGFFLALFLTAFVYVLIGPLRTTRKVLLILPVILAGAVLLPRLFLLAGNRNESNREREVTIDQVYDRTSALTISVGNGFGIGVPERPEHMEIVPLEIFYKQGLVGLCWWALFCGYVIVSFRNALRSEHTDLAFAFFLSFVFIGIESCTNPFINNPIGMTFVVLALTCLNVLSSDKKSLHTLGSDSTSHMRHERLLGSKEIEFG